MTKWDASCFFDTKTTGLMSGFGKVRSGQVMRPDRLISISL